MVLVSRLVRSFFTNNCLEPTLNFVQISKECFGMRTNVDSRSTPYRERVDSIWNGHLLGRSRTRRLKIRKKTDSDPRSLDYMASLCVTWAILRRCAYYTEIIRTKRLSIRNIHKPQHACIRIPCACDLIITMNDALA